MASNPIIYLPDGTHYEVQKAHNDNPIGQALGNTPYRVGYGKAAKAARKKGVWKDYYEMYRQHAIVRAAIDKVAKVCTNSGYDFTPRDSRTKTRKGEVTILKNFFYQQTDFIGELRKVYRDLLIYGDAYMEVVKDRAGRPSRLVRRAPHSILVEANRNGETLNYYQFDPNNVHVDPVVFDADEMLHFKLDDPDNDIYGLSPLESLKNAVATDLFAQSYNEKFFENSAITGLIITVKGSDEQEILRTRKWLEENFVGSEFAHTPIVLEGDVSIHKSVNSHNEMGFLEGRRQLIVEMLAVLDVPPVKVGIVESANRANSREQDKTFRSESIDPLQFVVESVINDQFVKNILGVVNTIWVHSESDTRDAQEQMALWVDAIQNGILTINEVRAMMGKSEIAGGDVAYVMSPTGAVPVVDLELYFKIPLANIDKIPPDLQPLGVTRDPATGGLQGPNPSTPGPSPGDPVVGVNKYKIASINLHGVQSWIERAYTDDQALRQAYAYAYEAASSNVDARVQQVYSSLSLAVGANDQNLRHAFIERAQMYMEEIRKAFADKQEERKLANEVREDERALAT